MSLAQNKTLWIALTAAGAILGLSIGVRQSLGLFVPSITADVGLSVTSISFALAIQNLIWGAMAPVAGTLADRFGTVKTLIGGAILYALGLYLMGQARSVVEFNLAAGLLLGIAIGSTTFALVLGAVGRMVPEGSRSLAFGLVSAGGSAGHFIMAPISGNLILALGWQNAITVLALISLLIAPLAFLLIYRPSTDSGPSAFASASKLSATTLRAAIGDAAGHSSYWMLFFGFFVCGFHVAFIAVHLPTFTAWCGLPQSVAHKSLAFIGLFNIVGTLLAGYLGTRLLKKRVLSAIYISRAVLILLFMIVPKTEATLLVFASCMGLLWLSTVPLTSGLVAQLWGTRYMATLYGFIMFSHQIGSFFGAWLGGVVYDQTGNYNLIWLAAAALGVFAALLHMPIAERSSEAAAAA